MIFGVTIFEQHCCNCALLEHVFYTMSWLTSRDLCIPAIKAHEPKCLCGCGHSYIGHVKERTVKEQMVRDSTEVLRKAVHRMLPRNKLRDVSVSC